MRNITVSVWFQHYLVQPIGSHTADLRKSWPLGTILNDFPETKNQIFFYKPSSQNLSADGLNWKSIANTCNKAARYCRSCETCVVGIWTSSHLIWYLIYLGSFFAPIGTIECFFQKTSKESLISAFTLQPWHCGHKLGRIVKQGHGAFHPRKLGVVISDLLKQACCNAWSIWNVHIVSYTVIVSTLIPDSSWRGYLEWCPLRVAVTNDGFILNWWDVG